MSAVHLSRSPRSLSFAALALALAGCSVDLQNVFDDGRGGSQTTSSNGGGGNGGVGGTGGEGGSGLTTTGGTTTTTSAGGTTTTSSTTSTGMMAVCGNGVCEPGENNGNCSADCPAGSCVHGVCEGSQTPLEDGCDPCVTAICAQDPSCCNEDWDGGCIGLANQLCNDVCCGDGQCAGESCGGCLADCGSCPPEPTCPHSVCFGNDNASPLNTTDCWDPCISEVCAVIDMDTDNCCDPSPPSWSAECTAKAKMLCGEYACIDDVCQAMPSCCTQNWTSACVDLVKTTPSCGGTECNCPHNLCSDGPGDTPFSASCNPCAAAVCEADPYCCDNDWDGICVGEVGTLCGIACN